MLLNKDDLNDIVVNALAHLATNVRDGETGQVSIIDESTLAAQRDGLSLSVSIAKPHRETSHTSTTAIDGDTIDKLGVLMAEYQERSQRHAIETMREMQRQRREETGKGKASGPQSYSGDTP